MAGGQVCPRLFLADQGRVRLTGIGAVVFVGSKGETIAEQLVQRATRAALLDLVEKLNDLDVHPVVVAGPDLSWIPASVDCVRDVDKGTFHFGTRLADLIGRYDLQSTMYFGAASSPLLTGDLLRLVVGMLHRSVSDEQGSIPSHIALTNNLHSSDWVAISHVQDALGIIRRANRDNSLAWMLQENWDYDVRVFSGMRPATSVDLDTPADLAIVRSHPDCSPRLLQELQDPLLDRVPVRALVDVLACESSRVAIMGRVSPLAWQALSKATQCWLRVYSEERGMVASERLDQGLVRSLLLRLLDLLGPRDFFSELAQIVDAVIIDTRVLMAARGRYPAADQRFASDLFLAADIEDEWLKEFTIAAHDASIPVLLGGHGVVAGGLYVLAEIVAQRRRHALSG